MKAIITVTGRDTVGIIAKVSRCCAEVNANILDITQKVLDNMFVMIMLVDISDIKVKFTEFVDMMDVIGKNENLVIHTMHEDIFNAMHKI